MRDGNRFEMYVKSHLRALVDEAGYEPTNPKRDKEQGVDCSIYRIPIDITLNYSHKCGTKYLGTIDVFGAYTITCGLRRHNGHHRLEEPVLVLGYNLAVEPREARLLITMLNKDLLLEALDMYLDEVYPVEEGV